MLGTLQIQIIYITYKRIHSHLPNSEPQMQAERKYQIIAEVYKCLLICDPQGSCYSFIIRIGDKLSAQSTKKVPLNENVIQFNERTTLQINQLDKTRAINCDILLFQHKHNYQKSIAGIASVSIEDLRLKQKRPIRLVNSFDKRASIELKIYQDKINEETYKSFKLLESNIKSERKSHERNLAANQLHYSRNSQDKYTLNQKKYNQNLSESSGTKTCPHYFQKSMQLPTQRKFSRKMQINHTNLSLLNILTPSDLDTSKEKANSPIQEIEKGKSSKESGYFQHKDYRGKVRQKGAQRKLKKQSLNKLNLQSVDSIQSLINARNDAKNRKNHQLSIYKSVNEIVNRRMGRNLNMNSGSVGVSINFDYKRRILVDRETMTEQKISYDFGVMTCQNEVSNKSSSTSDLIEKYEKEMQTNLAALKMDTLAGVTQLLRKKQNLNISSQLSLQINQQLMSKLDQNIEPKLIQTKEMERQTKHKLKGQYTEGCSDDQIFDLRISIHSQMDEQKHKFPHSSGSKQSATEKSANIPQNLQLLQINKESPNQFRNIRLKSNSISDCSQIYQNFKENHNYSQSLISSQDRFHSFTIVKTVQLRVRSLKQNFTKPFLANIKTTQNPKSKLQKIGFITKNDLSHQCPTIYQINESLQQSHEPSNFKLITSFKENRTDQICKKPKNQQNLDIKHDEYNEISIQINQEVSITDISQIIEEESYYYNEPQQEDNLRYSNQKDIKILTKQAKIMQETNQFDLKKANQFLQLTNFSIAQTLKSTKDSFSDYLFDCKNNTVRKQDYKKVEKQLKQLQQQLKIIQLSKTRLNEEKIRLESQKEQRNKQIEVLKKQNIKLTQNFRVLKKQYHAFAFEVIQKEVQNSQKQTENQKKTKKTQNSENLAKLIPPSGINQESLMLGPSKRFKTQKQISQRQFEGCQIYDSKLAKTQKIIPFLQYSSSQVQRNKNQHNRKVSVGSLSEMRPKQKKDMSEQKQSSGEKKQFRSFFERSIGKELKGNSFQTPRSHILSKIQYKKGITAQTSFFSQFPSTIIEDFINTENPKK